MQKPDVCFNGWLRHLQIAHEGVLGGFRAAIIVSSSGNKHNKEEI